MNASHRSAWLAALLAACATEAPKTGFDQSAGAVEVIVCGDGFVRSAGRRLPLEALVLELRQHTRAMPREDVLKFVVHVQSEAQTPGSPAALHAQRDVERLLMELQVMGVRQVRFL